MTNRVAEFLAKATAESVEVTIGELLTVWGYRTRSFESVPRIERDLSGAGLHCTPDLANGSLSTTVRVGMPPTAASATPGGREAAADEADESAVSAEDQPPRLPHIFPRIGDMPSAVGGVTSVRPDETLQDAQGGMVENGYSQLPVMSGPQELIGAVSWRSIAQAKLTQRQISLKDAIDYEPKVVHTVDKLIDQIDTIYDVDFVFVRNPDNIVCGIVTTADLTARFRDLTSPFFQLGEIEYRLRRCTRLKFNVAELRGAARSNKVNSTDDMTFGNYVFLLKDEEMWRKTEWEIPQDRFLDSLRKARDIRNKVAHYDAKPVSDAERQDIAHFLNWMRNLDRGPVW